MPFIDTPLPDLKIFEPNVWNDDRGYFYESYNENTFLDADIHYNWVQDNQAKSSYGVLRGLHYQVGKNSQAKLVRVFQGEVLDVVVDIRPDSITYGQSYSLILSEENKKQLLVPRGFAHGYAVLSETAIFFYKCDNFYSKEDEGGILYNDVTLQIDWLIPTEKAILSDKDLKQPVFGEHRIFF